MRDTIEYVVPEWTWYPMFVHQGPIGTAKDRHVVAARIQTRMLRILEEWRPARYMSGQRVKGEWADCVRFAGAVTDELYGHGYSDVPAFPDDQQFHDRRRAARAMHTVRKCYPRSRRVRDGSLEPGDWVVTGPRGGGPGHAMLVGPRPNTLWHCNRGPGVCWTGIGLASEDQAIHRVYRFLDRNRWLR